MDLIKVTLIGEIGCNHGGSIRRAKKMIKKLAQLEFDFAKFQYYKTSHIIMAESGVPGNLYTPDILKYIRKAEFVIADFQELASYCDKVGIQFLCTPFLTVKRVQELEDLVNPTHWKIRQRDSKTYTLIDEVLKTGKPVFLSSTEFSLDHLYLHHPSITWMLTIPKYPAQIIELDLWRAGVWGGYSNHIPHLSAPIAAVTAARTLGLTEYALEVHVKHGGLFHRDIDANVSFNYKQLKQLVEYVRMIEQCPSTKELF